MSAFATEIPVEETPPSTQSSSTPSSSSWTPTIVRASEIWTDNAEDIASLSDPPIIDGILREKEVASVVGAAKTAKTWFAMSLGLAVAQGHPFLGRATHRRNVLYIDYELKEATIRKRICMLSDRSPEGFSYICQRGAERQPRPNDIAQLVVSQDIGLVIIDSLYRTGWQQEENNNDSMSRDLTPLQSFTATTNASMLVIDHTGKGGGEGRSVVDTARGASAKGGFYDSVIALRAFHKADDPEGCYAALDAALRDWPRLQKLPLVSFAWTATSCNITQVDEVDRGEVNSNANRILQYLASRPSDWIPTTEIVGHLKLSNAAVSKLLKQLVASGKCEFMHDPTHIQRKLYQHKEPSDPTLTEEAIRNAGFQ